ncbi:BON domain-containing protein [Actinoplanes xinjiangensis]|uniref:BON domain-containing protein n=1 Tax=Actinoplanes xinjiangensis TaxID=512350 RepID=UPI000D6BB894|nr:BON domain-containing protein [Actinoplanes xinjiangensis]
MHEHERRIGPLGLFDGPRQRRRPTGPADADADRVAHDGSPAPLTVTARPHPGSRLCHQACADGITTGAGPAAPGPSCGPVPPAWQGRKSSSIRRWEPARSAGCQCLVGDEADGDPATAGVREGVVTLTGRVGHRSTADRSVRFVRQVPGVVGVVDSLRFDNDDREILSAGTIFGVA